jgi:multisubunit Na+/H+ antiporter MnhB subunit
MSEALNRKTLIVIVIVGILLTSSTSMTFVNAQLTPTSLTITVQYNSLGLECTIEATLKDENEKLLQNMDIAFLWTHSSGTHIRLDTGTDCVHQIGTATTDANRVASLTYTFEYAETWTISANFSGTTSYAPSSSEYVNITIVDYTPYLVGGGIITIGVIGYILYRRRKKAIAIQQMMKK